MTSPFHAGELEVQARAGVASAAGRVGKMIRRGMTADHAAFVAAQQLAVVSAVDGAGRVWASALTGSPGFLRPLDAATVAVHAALAPDDPLAGVLKAGGSIGMVVMDLATRSRVRLNGRAEPKPEGGFVQHVAEAYGNCPKYIQLREFSPPAHEPPARAAIALSGTELTPAQREWIAGADTFFIGSRAGERADASHRGGNPGFVSVPTAALIRWPDYPGNMLFNTLGNLASDPRAGLLFLDFERDRSLQLTGTAAILWDTPADGVAPAPGAERAVELHVTGVVERLHATGRRWKLVERSPYNP